MYRCNKILHVNLIKINCSDLLSSNFSHADWIYNKATKNLFSGHFFEKDIEEQCFIWTVLVTYPIPERGVISYHLPGPTNTCTASQVCYVQETKHLSTESFSVHWQWKNFQNYCLELLSFMYQLNVNGNYLNFYIILQTWWSI